MKSLNHIVGRQDNLEAIHRVLFLGGALVAASDESRAVLRQLETELGFVRVRFSFASRGTAHVTLAARQLGIVVYNIDHVMWVEEQQRTPVEAVVACLRVTQISRDDDAARVLTAEVAHRLLGFLRQARAAGAS